MLTKLRGRPGVKHSPWRALRLAPFNSQDNNEGRGRRTAQFPAGNCLALQVRQTCKTLKLGRRRKACKLCEAHKPERFVSGRFPSAVRGQIALWMLTKFAMVFFIILLAAMLVSFSDAQKESICRTQAQSMARNIASTVANVINSPVEDERKVFTLESSLSVGKSQLERYIINITNIRSASEPKTGSLVVHVKSGSGCEGYARAPYDASLVLVEPVAMQSRWAHEGNLTLKPSDLQRRDYYFIMAKCRPKQAGFSSYLYLRQCDAPLGVAVDPQSCDPRIDSNFTALSDRLKNPVLQCCGWEALQDVPTTNIPGKTAGQPLCP